LDKFDRQFGIGAPTDVIDFSNLSTLPPLYSVISVDTSACGKPCVVSAVIQNLGGRQGAVGPSTITFTLTAAVSGSLLGSCRTQVHPDIGYSAAITVACAISGLGGAPLNAATVTATAENPGRG